MSDNKETPAVYDSVDIVSPSNDPKVYHHKVIIQDFKKVTEDYPNKKKLVCDGFKIPIKYSTLPCHFDVYPSGSREKDDGWLSVYLYAKPTDDMDFKMNTEFTCINADGKKQDVHEIKRHVSYYKQLGYGKFIKHTDIFDASKKILKNGSLTLAFKITILQNDIVMKSKQFSENGDGVTKDHFNFMKKLLENPEDFGGDFIIVCSDLEEVKCHTGILSANSEVFKGMLAKDSISKEKKEGRVHMKELDKEICNIILRFVYTGCLDEDKITMELYQQADKMGFLRLKDICSKHLINFIDKDNCIATLGMADAIGDDNLKDAAADCLEENAVGLANELKNNINGQDLLPELYVRLAKRLKYSAN